MSSRLYKTMHSISDDGKISNELSTNSKLITRFSCKSNPIKIIKRERLSGGADVNNIKENVENVAESINVAPIESTVESSKEIPEESSKEFLASESALIDKQIYPSRSPTHLTSDNKINEIIEYAHQNLQDAGKALATLKENFEHGLKLAIVDVLGRIQHWSTTVQNKLDDCKEDIERLRKELLSQIHAINDKENKIRELNKQIADLTVEVNRLKQQIAECMNEKTYCEKMLTEKRTELEGIKTTKLELPSPVIQALNPDNLIKQNLNNSIEKPIEKSERPEKMERPEKIERLEKIERPKQIERPEKIERPKQIERPEKIEGPEKIERPEKIEETKEMKRRCSVQAREKDKERKRREMELESEIGRLRKENEKLMKERIDYENAIQRALLRGVSSLNVEALRVLRCPPIPCCSPCAPCPMSFIPTTEDSTPCPAKMKQPYSAHITSKECSNSYGNGKNMKCENTIKLPCGSPCCSARKNQKGSNNSMFFLLHQGDAENAYKLDERSSSRPCGSPIMKKIEIPPC